MQKMCDFIETVQEASIKTVLNKVLSLYGLWSLEKHLTILYQGGFATGSQPATLIRQGILDLCEQIKPDAVALVDAIAPHDFLMMSPLGKSDGQVIQYIYIYFFFVHILDGQIPARIFDILFSICSIYIHYVILQI